MLAFDPVKLESIATRGAPGSPLIVSLYHFLPPRLSYTSPNVMADSQWSPAILWIHL
ncbi:hypothetical protein KAM484_39810 [Aeromonas caviae]|nr:hypothetical protein KAM467_38800 [Aeromonas caviae]GKR54783.1 hypothetical protein KAM475_39300 [Aeromonas caviae]GKR93176.1 hypothetical protein KAM484_39810 [Aeromonas caviae]